jgi:site-specific recombinase XerD
MAPDWNIDQWAQDALGRQGLAEYTVTNLRRQLRFMEDVVPLHPVPLEENWICYVANRRTAGATPFALKTARHGLLSLLDFLEHRDRTKLWRPRPFRQPKHEVRIPSMELVRQLVHIPYFQPEPLNALARHLLHFGHFVGIRPPSEFLAMTVDSLDLRTGVLEVIEDKKNDRKRYLHLETWIWRDPNEPSLKNYLEHWRPKWDRGATDALWIFPDGRPMTENWLRIHLAPRVRTATGFPWKPYSMRHFAATYRYYEWRDLIRVRDWMGHESVKQTETYVKTIQQLFPGRIDPLAKPARNPAHSYAQGGAGSFTSSQEHSGVGEAPARHGGSSSRGLLP